MFTHNQKTSCHPVAGMAFVVAAMLAVAVPVAPASAQGHGVFTSLFGNPRPVAPYIDVLGKRPLFVAQALLFGEQRFALCLAGLRDLAAHPLQLFADGDEVTLDGIRPAVKRFLQLAKSLTNHHSFPKATPW